MFIWRSVWESKSVLSAGLKWSVGSGENIKIYGQPWLGNDSNPYIISEPMPLENFKVSSLFYNGSRVWNIELIRDMFVARDQDCIINTKVHEQGSEDRLYWCKETSGVYSVRSAYRLLQAQKNLWQSRDNISFWRKVWRVKAPPKVLNLIWRALSNSLPTKSQLVQKFVPILNTCPFCNTEEETTMHVLVTCPVAKQCWVGLLPVNQVNDGTDFGT